VSCSPSVLRQKSCRSTRRRLFTSCWGRA
jgi:hypothetical protein